MTPLEKYMMQQQMQAGSGQSGLAAGPAGGGGQPAVPMGQGIADPFNSGADSQEMTNPGDGMDEFDPRRRPRAYLGGTADRPAPVAGSY